MKQFTLTLFATCLTLMSFGQMSVSEKLIELGKTYNKFMFRNEPTKTILKDLKSDIPEDLRVETEFIVQSITTGNKLLTKPYLTRPTDQVLKMIYIIRAISLNEKQEKAMDNLTLIAILSVLDLPAHQLVDNYYAMIFTSVGNKNQPFNLSKTDLKLNEYNLKNDTEKGILALQATRFCGMTIWGFMNIVKPANTQKALANIDKFPKINGSSYYQFTDFYFPDFEMEINKDKGPESYKGFYLDKLYETLMSHFICLDKEGRSDKEKKDLLLGSILKDHKLYRYTKYQAVLEDVFKEQKND